MTVQQVNGCLEHCQACRDRLGFIRIYLLLRVLETPSSEGFSPQLRISLGIDFSENY